MLNADRFWYTEHEKKSWRQWCVQTAGGKAEKIQGRKTASYLVREKANAVLVWCSVYRRQKSMLNADRFWYTEHEKKSWRQWCVQTAGGKAEKIQERKTASYLVRNRFIAGTDTWRRRASVLHQQAELRRCARDHWSERATVRACRHWQGLVSSKTKPIFSVTRYATPHLRLALIVILFLKRHTTQMLLQNSWHQMVMHKCLCDLRIQPKCSDTHTHRTDIHLNDSSAIEWKKYDTEVRTATHQLTDPKKTYVPSPNTAKSLQQFHLLCDSVSNSLTKQNRCRIQNA